MIQAQATSPQKLVISKAFNDRLLRRPEVENKTGLSRSAIYAAIKNEIFLNQFLFLVIPWRGFAVR